MPIYPTHICHTKYGELFYEPLDRIIFHIFETAPADMSREEFEAARVQKLAPEQAIKILLESYPAKQAEKYMDQIELKDYYLQHKTRN